MILVIPGYTNSGPEHWQSLWERARPNARRVEQRDWERPVLDEWVAALDEAVSACADPPVLVAHSLGCLTVAHWAAAHDRRIAGALLVAPADVEQPGTDDVLRGFGPIPMRWLPFPTILVASRDDPWCAFHRARAFAEAWGSRMDDAGDAGHIDTASGHGPWPGGEALLFELVG